MSAESVVAVFAEMRARPGKEQALQEALRTLAGHTRQEQGCLHYAWHVARGEQGRILFYENWASQAHLDAHLESPHMKAFMARAEELLEGAPRIVVASRAG